VIVDIPVKGQAEVLSTVLLRRRNTALVEPVAEDHQVKMVLVKGNKQWLFSKVTLPQALVE
jgi:hypothetical protein